MFDPEKILRGLLTNNIGGFGGDHRNQFWGSKKKKKKKGYSQFSNLLGSGTSTAVKMGILGVAVGAVEHFMQQNNANQQGQGMMQQPGYPGVAPMPPGGQTPMGTGATPPPPPPGAGSMPGAAPPQPTVSSQAQQDAVTLIHAMIAAAYADGLLDAEERKNIVDRFNQLDLSTEERSFLMNELLSPPSMDDIVKQVNSPELAQQVYTISLMTIDVDTEQERQYLRDLAHRLSLDETTVQNIHQMLNDEKNGES